MLDQWILDKLAALKQPPMIVLRDPQRMIQPGARAVHGWAEENGYSVLFCTGNLGLREMYEAVREEADTRVLLVDRSRSDARIPLFYPDLDAAAGPRRQLALSLREYLVEVTGDPRWPHLVDDRNLARLILAHLPGVLAAHEQLRKIGGDRFSDSDLHRIVLGAVLHINPFKPLTPPEIRRLCVEQHQAMDELKRLLPESVLSALRTAIAAAPKPFCYLWDRDPVQVIRAFTLAAIMRQHSLEYQVLLTNLDPSFKDYREIETGFLAQAMQDQLHADPDRVAADVAGVEAFLREDQTGRLAFLIHERLGLDEREKALAALKNEKLSGLIRGLALLSLLLDLIETRQVKFHGQVLKVLDAQAQDPELPALRRPSESWQALETAYRRACTLHQLTGKLAGHYKKLKVTAAADLDFGYFDKLWNEDQINRLDFYASDLGRMLRVGDILPIARKEFWPALAARWERGRDQLAGTLDAILEALELINTRFQDMYVLHYANWIRKPHSPVVFTHQFLSRLLRVHWDPKSGRKAVILVFDGLRTDAWDEFVRPVLEERFQVIAGQPGSALIPTETQLSRKAIAAGKLPAEFTTGRELDLLTGWLKQNMQLSPRFDVVVDDDTTASGISVRYVSDQLEYIVFSFTDHNLHHNEQDLAFIYKTTVREIVRQDVRSVLRELPEDALIFVTSDHGFTPVPGGSVLIPGSVVADVGDVKYLNARTRAGLEGEDAGHVVDFDPLALGVAGTSLKSRELKIKHVLFPRPGYTFKRSEGRHDPDRYSHGGVSLAECMVPMVVMGPRTATQPALMIDAVRQVGSMSEGEPLALEIAIVPLRLAIPPTAVTLSFSRDEIPVRKEVFVGRAATYTVRWTPELTEIGDDDRRRGALAQPVTVILTYRDGDQTIRTSKSIDVQIKLDSTRLRRRIDSKLDLLMGKTPKGLQD